ncbi:response regulator transcription factor [Kribbella sp. CA-293567]|uniref:response regulator transcription factor n=1 Tax=Kribbella sp. CA-293567 TaxID=3002436 RepID=UPI0022DD9E00|nr:response regulator transcription factor [Kribbella sp. CA-293567]WBQ04328.1 response regulator transcription factor [Kribbella sp. CA-293567]
MRVLIAGVDQKFVATTARELRRLSMAVDVCRDGNAALDRAGLHQYAVIVLDSDLPGVPADEVVRKVVASGEGPRLLLLTRSVEVSDRVEGLAIGADDVLSWPFATEELVARIQALGRRSMRALPPVRTWQGVVLDLPRHQASREGRFLQLSPKEFAVLDVLMRAAGVVVSAEELLEQAWDEHVDPFTNAVRVTMMTLRRKLGSPALIETVPGVGYRLCRTPETLSSQCG